MAVIKEENSFPDVKVQIVASKSDADLLVFVTRSKSDADGRDEIWYFDHSFPTKKVRFVTSFPDLIYYVRGS